MARGDILIAQAMGEFFYVKENIMNNLKNFLNEGAKIDQSIPSSANDSVTFTKISDDKNSIGIINIDGAMYKKDMSGMCMSVASYTSIMKLANQAKIMYVKKEIGALCFRVTTPGGGVHGLDALENMISKMNMPTFTHYEDMGCSAGIYAFTATKELYASPMTELGSIGTVVQMNKQKKSITITSSRAKNKRLDLSTKEGRKKLQDELDIYENKFYQIVEKNTGFNAHQIEKEFDNGGTIMSEKAKEIGFIEDVIYFEDLIDMKLKSMGGNTTAKTEATASAPTASGDKVVNSKTGANMKFDRNNLDATEANFNSLLESKQHLNDNISLLNDKNSNLQSSLDDANAKLEEANGKLSEAVSKDEVANQVAAKLDKNNKTMVARIEQAYSNGTTKKETLLAMVAEPDDKKASQISLDAKDKHDALHEGEGSKKKESSVLTYAQKMKGSIK